MLGARIGRRHLDCLSARDRNAVGIEDAGRVGGEQPSRLGVGERRPGHARRVEELLGRVAGSRRGAAGQQDQTGQNRNGGSGRGNCQDRNP